MGANDKNEPKEVTLTKEQEEIFGDALVTIRSIVDDIRAAGTPIREFALGFTKLEEAEMWLDRGFDSLGMEVSDPDDPDDDEDDDESDEGDEGDDEGQGEEE